MAQGVAIAPDRRNAIIEAALPLLAEGVPTDEIARQLGDVITGKTLRVWLLTMPEAEQARTIYLADEVLAAYEEQKAARVSGDHDAARSAAAEFKSAAWLAERRLSTLFGAKSEVNHGVQISVTINNPSLPSARPALTLDHDE